MARGTGNAFAAHEGVQGMRLLRTKGYRLCVCCAWRIAINPLAKGISREEISLIEISIRELDNAGRVSTPSRALRRSKDQHTTVRPHRHRGAPGRAAQAPGKENT